MAAFLAAIVCVCLIACSSENEEPEQPQTFLNINIFAPTDKKSSLVRADHGSVQAINNENLIYDVWVWAFLTGDTQGDNAKPVGSLYKKLGGVSSTTCQMGIAPNIIVGDKKLDIYVVTNSEAIPSGAYGMGHNLTLSEVKNLQFGKMTRNATTYDDFGVSAPQNTVQEDKGLPMSQYAIGQDVINASKLSKSVNIKLRRAVSKLRFVFARRTGLPNVQVTGFTLEGSLIPNQEYVFPDNTNDRTPHINTSAGYDATALTFTQTLDTESILQHDNPKSLGWNGSENGETYTNRLEEAFGTYTSSLYYGLTYLRETGEKLKGIIRYKLSADGTERTIGFEMPEANDFTRNHEYLVYAYFDGGKLYVSPTALPWKDGGTVENTTKVVSNLEHMGYYMYNSLSPKDYDDWAHNFVAIAFDDGFISGKKLAPQLSPLIILRTSDDDNLRIQTNNPDFCFVLREPVGDGSYIYNLMDNIVIPSGYNVETCFYVVPTHNFNMAAAVPPNLDAMVFLTTTSSTFLLVTRMPWNTILPGSEDHTEIWFHYVSKNVYNNPGQNGEELKIIPPTQ